MAEVLCWLYICPAFCNGRYLIHRPLNYQYHSFQAQKPALQVTLHGVLRYLGKDSLHSETDEAGLPSSVNYLVSVHHGCVGFISA